MICQEHQLLFITSGVSRLAEQAKGLEANQLAVSHESPFRWDKTVCMTHMQESLR